MQSTTATGTGTPPLTFLTAITQVHDLFIASADITNTYALFCQIERALWHYEDNIANQYELPHYKLKKFGETLFCHSPLLTHLRGEYETMYREFMAVRATIPRAGCIIMNHDLNKIVLVCSLDGLRWASPKGKCDVDEDPFEGALREVLEETGFDARPFTDPKPFLKIQHSKREITYFLSTNVPEDTVFAPITQNEISAVRFFPLNDVPEGTHYYKEIHAALELMLMENLEA